MSPQASTAPAVRLSGRGPQYWLRLGLGLRDLTVGTFLAKDSQEGRTCTLPDCWAQVSASRLGCNSLPGAHSRFLAQPDPDKLPT